MPGLLFRVTYGVSSSAQRRKLNLRVTVRITHKFLCHASRCSFCCQVKVRAKLATILLSVRGWTEATVGASRPTFKESKGLLKDRGAEAGLGGRDFLAKNRQDDALGPTTAQFAQHSKAEMNRLNRATTTKSHS